MQKNMDAMQKTMDQTNVGIAAIMKRLGAPSGRAKMGQSKGVESSIHSKHRDKKDSRGRSRSSERGGGSDEDGSGTDH